MTDSNDPDQIRREIARTRADMDRTLAELEDRLSPSRIKERQTERMRSRWQQTRESVMGAMPGDGDGTDIGDRMSGIAHDAGGVMRDAPERVEEMARGNPLAAGLIAFGVGALMGSMFPSTRAEQAMASELRMEFEEPVRAELRESGQQMQSELQDHAQEAVEEVRHTAQEGAERTQQQARGSAEELREHADSSTQRPRERP